MNRAATQDLRAVLVWPVVAKVLAGGRAPSALAQKAVELVNAWARHGASRLDTTGDGKITDPGGGWARRDAEANRRRCDEPSARPGAAEVRRDLP
jgi:hypothetical protein